MRRLLLAVAALLGLAAPLQAQSPGPPFQSYGFPPLSALSGTLPITKGGTGQITGGAALTALSSGQTYTLSGFPTFTAPGFTSQNLGGGGNLYIGGIPGGAFDYAGGINVSGTENTYLGDRAGSRATGSNNTAIGHNALGNGGDASFAGSNLTAIGTDAMRDPRSGLSNSTAIGVAAMRDYVGTFSVAIGVSALTGKTDGTSTADSNIAIGYTAMGSTSMTSAARNVVVGPSAGNAMTSAADNVGLGYHAMLVATSAPRNIAIGTSALLDIVSGGDNTVIGYTAAQHMTGNNSVFIGSGAGDTGTSTANGTVAVGYLSCRSVTGAINICLGQQVGNTITSGTQNILIGGTGTDVVSSATGNSVGIGANTKPGTQDVAVGESALAASTGNTQQNAAFGYQAGTAVTSGSRNTFLGHSAAAALITGADNVALGQNSTISGTNTNQAVSVGSGAAGGSQGVSIGYVAGLSLSAGTSNVTVVGWEAGRFISTGAGNTALGSSAMLGITGTRITGANNTAVGMSAGLLLQGAAATNALFGSSAGASITTGSSNVVIGPSVASTTLTTGSSNVLIGASSALTTAAAGTSNTIGIGTSSTCVFCATGGDVVTTAVSTVHGASVVLPDIAQTSAAQTGTVCWAAASITYDASLGCLASDERLKSISGAPDDPLGKIVALKPITYQWTTPEKAADPGEHIGLGAFATGYVDERLIARDPEGNPRGWRQDAMIALLIGAVQEQQKQIADLRKTGTR